jgi:hypothetical protein
MMQSHDPGIVPKPRVEFAQQQIKGDCIDSDGRLLFHRLVEYTNPSIAFQRDKLAAFAGIAKNRKQLSHDHVIGTWQDFGRTLLMEDLLGTRKRYHGESISTAPISRVSTTKSPTWVAPIWSWASFSGPVTFYSARDHQDTTKLYREATCALLEAQCDAAGEGNFGLFSAGHLILRGRLRPQSGYVANSLRRRI